MKLTLIITLVLLGTVCRGQKRDTIPVILLTCDTSLQYYQNEPGANCWNCPATYYDHICYWQRGYEVGYKDHTVDQHAMDLISTTYLIWHHVAYLDDNRKPITFLVWDSKNITPK